MHSDGQLAAAAVTMAHHNWRIMKEEYHDGPLAILANLANAVSRGAAAARTEVAKGILGNACFIGLKSLVLMVTTRTVCTGERW